MHSPNTILGVLLEVFLLSGKMTFSHFQGFLPAVAVTRVGALVNEHTAESVALSTPVSVASLVGYTVLS